MLLQRGRRQGVSLSIPEPRMSERINEILEVLATIRGTVGRNIYGGAVQDSRLAALKQVARQRHIDPNTVRDKFGRQLQPNVRGVREFDQLVERWLTSSPDELEGVLRQHAVSDDDDRRIQEFFASDRKR